MSAEALCVATVAALNRNDLDKALALCTKGIAHDPKYLKFYEHRVTTLIKLRRFDDALKDCNTIMRLDGSYAKGYLLAGGIFIALKNPALAIKTYKLANGKVKDTDPLYKDILSNYALCRSMIAPSDKDSQDRKRKKTATASSADPKAHVPGAAEEDSVTKKGPKATLNTASQKNLYNMGKFHIPAEVFNQILHSIPMIEVAKCARVSRHWNEAIKFNKLLWVEIDLSPFYNRVKPVAVVSLVRRSRGLLKSLNLENCFKVNNTILRPLMASRCPLTTFRLSNNMQIQNYKLYQALHVFRDTLTNLTLRAMRLDDRTVKEIIASCTKLESLDVSHCELITSSAFSDGFSKALATIRPAPDDSSTPQLPLRSLDVTGCNMLNNDIITALTNACPSLKDLTVAGCVSITQEGIARMAGLTALQSLDLSNTNTSTPESTSLEDTIAALVDGTRDLHKVVLTNTPTFDDIALTTFATGCPKLAHVDFRGCVMITDHGVGVLAEMCIGLRVVCLRMCPRVTDAGILRLAEQVKGLKHVDVGANPSLTDSAVVALAECEELRVVVLAGCPKVTGAGVGPLIRKLGRRLAYLDIDNCVGISPDAVVGLRSAVGRKGVISAVYT